LFGIIASVQHNSGVTQENLGPEIQFVLTKNPAMGQDSTAVVEAANRTTDQSPISQRTWTDTKDNAQ
jgi:hypothetical protein